MLYETERIVKEFGNEQHNNSLVQTLNHIGCVERTLDNFENAKNYFAEAIRLSSGSEEVAKLNLCAVNSSLGDHKTAKKDLKTLVKNLTLSVLDGTTFSIADSHK